MEKCLVQILAGIALFAFGCSDHQTSQEDPVERAPHVLIFSKTTGFRHASIEPGAEAMTVYFRGKGVTSMRSEDASIFTTQGLDPFDVVIFFNTTGNVLDSVHEDALMHYIRSGKGFVGIHSASDTEYDWNWYSGLVGAQFASHPEIQEAVVMKTDTAHPSCKHIPERWTRTDEWYNFRQAPANVNVVLAVDEATYQGGSHGSEHPVSWYHLYDGGRSFYTAMGHTVESYQDTLFLRHILEATKWAAD